MFRLYKDTGFIQTYTGDVGFRASMKTMGSAFKDPCNFCMCLEVLGRIPAGRGYAVESPSPYTERCMYVISRGPKKMPK